LLLIHHHPSSTMPKAASASTSKAATKKANTKTAKAPKEKKEKRPPSAYNVFCAANMKPWIEAHPDNKKGAMKAMGEMWAKAPENPKNTASTNKSKVPKATASSSPASSSQPDDAQENDGHSSDAGLDVV